MADYGVGASDGQYRGSRSRRDQISYSDAEIARLSLGHDAEPAPPPPPDIESPGIVAVDITGKFSEAVKSKGPGQRANHPALRVLADPWRSPISGRAGQRWLLHAL